MWNLVVVLGLLAAVAAAVATTSDDCSHDGHIFELEPDAVRLSHAVTFHGVSPLLLTRPTPPPNRMSPTSRAKSRSKEAASASASTTASTGASPCDSTRPTSKRCGRRGASPSGGRSGTMYRLSRAMRLSLLSTHARGRGGWSLWMGMMTAVVLARELT